MREIFVLKQINQSYRSLNLKYSRLIFAFLLMILTAILEMSGLSIIYPLVLSLVGDGSSLSNIFSYLPFSPPFLQENKIQIIILFCGIVILNTAKNIALYFSYRYNINFAMYYYRNLICGLYNAYVHKSLFEFRKESSGSLANIICVQSGRLVDGVIRPLLVLITEMFLLVSISILVFFISPWLIAVIILMCGGAAGAYYALFRGKAIKWGSQRMEAASILQELVNNTSLGISEIKVFGKEDYLTSKLYSAAVIETNMFRNLEMHQQGPRFLIESVFVVTFVTVFIVFLIVGTDLSILLAKFSVITASSFRILPCINRLVGSYSNFSFNIGPALSLLNTISEFNLHSKLQGNKKNNDNPKNCSFELIELHNISLEYASVNKPVLKDLNGVVKMGQRVGIVGASGCGKSTLIDILAGLYTPTTGAVVVDDQPIYKDLRSWQANIGYVAQVPFIMPGTIRENVTFEPDGAGNDDEVWCALEKVGLSSFVSSLPHGIKTKIGEKSVGLSGGQKQLLCMARALFRNPKILLLDEPTAALDIDNELIVLKAIESLPPDTTIVMVSHKQQNFHDFDLVYICEHGRLRPQKSSERQTVV